MAVNALPAGWPSATKWREEIARQLADRFDCRTYSKPTGSINSPCIVVLPSVTKPWYESQRDNPEATTCTHRLNFAVLMVGGKPNSDAAWLNIEDWSAGLQVALDDLHESEDLAGYYGAPASVGDINGPVNVNIGGQDLLAAVADLSIETHL